MYPIGYILIESSGMEALPRELIIYTDLTGNAPFETWLSELRDVQGRAIIRRRLNRLRMGNLGDAKSVGSGVFELRIDFGPGYRVYFSERGKKIIILLCGGDKSTQTKDILQAKNYWKVLCQEN